MSPPFFKVVVAGYAIATKIITFLEKVKKFLQKIEINTFYIKL